ncbi:MAG: hypothetical protein FJW64_00395 [Actinobacteria bacterium]|nr:hypothetical protein [Actinomycetota bacterium]
MTEPAEAPEAVYAAFEWVSLLRAGDFMTAWATMTPTLRLALTQLWIVANPEVLDTVDDRDVLAAELAQPTPDHALWTDLSRDTEREIRKVTTDPVGDRKLGLASTHRPLSPGLEIARLVPLDQLDQPNGQAVWLPEQTVHSVTLIMQWGEHGWSVAGLADHLYTPGWPPTVERVVEPHD